MEKYNKITKLIKDFNKKDEFEKLLKSLGEQYAKPDIDNFCANNDYLISFNYERIYRTGKDKILRYMEKILNDNKICKYFKSKNKKDFRHLISLYPSAIACAAQLWECSCNNNRIIEWNGEDISDTFWLYYNSNFRNDEFYNLDAIYSTHTIYCSNCIYWRKSEFNISSHLHDDQPCEYKTDELYKEVLIFFYDHILNQKEEQIKAFVPIIFKLRKSSKIVDWHVLKIIYEYL